MLKCRAREFSVMVSFQYLIRLLPAFVVLIVVWTTSITFAGGSRGLWTYFLMRTNFVNGNYFAWKITDSASFFVDGQHFASFLPGMYD